jgi:single-strand DNA-binding protein
MANLNKVLLIGRLAKDPEVRTFPSGGKVAKFRFAVNFTRSRKDPATGQWKDGESAFIDVEAFNKQWEGAASGRQLADLVEQYLKKGNQIYVEGRLRMDQWEQDGQKRSRILIVADDIQFLESRGEGGGGGEDGSRSRVSTPPQRQANPSASSRSNFEEPERDVADSPRAGGEEGEIPF